MRSLRTYRQKRDFEKTREPRGASRRQGGLSYVIQKHAARRLHYDFRLELDGVLLSWAVPKGPSLDPKVRRLAQQTEDHPLEYGGFEGTIPKGEYGGGTVMLWDRGSWVPEGDAREQYEKGRLTFELRGEHLTGRWHLVRTGRDHGKSWLLFKGRDDVARDDGDALLEAATTSVASRRTMDEIASGAPAPTSTWCSTTRAASRLSFSSVRSRSTPGARVRARSRGPTLGGADLHSATTHRPPRSRASPRRRASSESARARGNA
jgi:bifunctional non-homologous end joining protein LigD